jgi:hypothetical protein
MVLPKTFLQNRTILSSVNIILFDLMPVGVATRLARLRDLLWGGLGDEFKFHLVSWELEI